MKIRRKESVGSILYNDKSPALTEVPTGSFYNGKPVYKKRVTGISKPGETPSPISMTINSSYSILRAYGMMERKGGIMLPVSYDTSVVNNGDGTVTVTLTDSALSGSAVNRTQLAPLTTLSDFGGANNAWVVKKDFSVRADGTYDFSVGFNGQAGWSEIAKYFTASNFAGKKIEIGCDSLSNTQVDSARMALTFYNGTSFGDVSNFYLGRAKTVSPLLGESNYNTTYTFPSTPFVELRLRFYAISSNVMDLDVGGFYMYDVNEVINTTDHTKSLWVEYTK